MGSVSSISRVWLRLRSRGERFPSALHAADVGEAPLRAQLFSAEQMELHGRALALTHHIHAGRVPDRLLSRLSDNAALLEDARAFLSRMVRDNIRITPAGEWLLDNYT